jgi:tetratricopeptide (TPR) repeat protein
MMKHLHCARLCLTGSVLVMAFLFHGCSILSPVGNTISLGYENMVTYFNGYYNAKRLFSEAEDEIKTAALLARGKDIPASQVNQIPASTKQKLGQVIDKCSYILAFHSTSSLVDNSLLLIGMSFFYQAEYLKAERKFVELLAQFPNSSLALEAQLWYARTEEKLGKFNEGIRESDAVIVTAKNNSENVIETQARQLLGELYRRMNQTDKSIAEYEKAIAISKNDDAKCDAQIRVGDIYFADGQFKKAREAYLRAEEYTSDIYLIYYSKLQASIAYRETGAEKEGLSLLNSMIDDFHYKEYLAALLYERANNYDGSGRRDDAIAEYIYVDTTYARTGYAVRSAYALGSMFEKEIGNYQEALKYYSEVNTAVGPSIVAEGHRKFAAFTRYFDAWRRLNAADSLIGVISDTTHKAVLDTLNTLAADTTQRKVSHGDSLSVSFKTDTLRTKNVIPDTVKRKPVQVVVQPVLPSIDSLRVLKSIAAQELGDIFYSEVVEPDSAFHWYNQSLAWNYNHSRSPRILYILAELSRINPEKKLPLPEEYHSRLDRDFPESMYAEEARRFLRKPSAAVKTDSASEYYALSEKQIDDRQYEKAIETLRSLIQVFPKSTIAAKSEYAIGWIMENRLAQPENARVQYKKVVKNYASTMFAAAALKRTLDVQAPDTIKSDTLKTKNNPQLQKPFSPDSVQRNTVRFEKDSVKHVPVTPQIDRENEQGKNPVSKPKVIDKE